MTTTNTDNDRITSLVTKLRADVAAKQVPKVEYLNCGDARDVLRRIYDAYTHNKDTPLSESRARQRALSLRTLDDIAVILGEARPSTLYQYKAPLHVTSALRD